MKNSFEMPDERRCEELGLPHKLLCRRAHILASKLGVTDKEFDGSFAASLPRIRLGQRWRYSTAGVIRAFQGVG